MKTNLTKREIKQIALREISDFSEEIIASIREKNEYADGTWTEDDVQMINDYIEEICGRLFEGAISGRCTIITKPNYPKC